MERAAALTGRAGRPMIASGYEKAAREWTNSLDPNGLESVPARPAILTLPRVRLRTTDAPRNGNPVPLAAGLPARLNVRARPAV